MSAKSCELWSPRTDHKFYTYYLTLQIISKCSLFVGNMNVLTSACDTFTAQYPHKQKPLPKTTSRNIETYRIFDPVLGKPTVSSDNKHSSAKKLSLF